MKAVKVNGFGIEDLYISPENAQQQQVRGTVTFNVTPINGNFLPMGGGDYRKIKEVITSLEETVKSYREVLDNSNKALTNSNKEVKDLKEYINNAVRTQGEDLRKKDEIIQKFTCKVNEMEQQHRRDMEAVYNTINHNTNYQNG